MDRELFKKTVETGKIQWQRHALERMMEREISRKAVKETLCTGEVIEEYPDDKPYPSALFLGKNTYEPLHVVAAFDNTNEKCFVITAYKPDLLHFEADYRTRRKYGD